MENNIKQIIDDIYTVDIKSFIDVKDTSSKILNYFTVDGTALKNALQDIRILMQKTSYAQIFQMSIKSNRLEFRAETALLYFASIPIKTEDDLTDIEVMCLYEDIVDAIPGASKVNIEFTPTFVNIETKYSTISISVCDATIQKTPLMITQPKNINVNLVTSSISILSGLTTITNAYKKSSVFFMNDEYMQVRYPTLWMQDSNDGIKCILDANSTKVLKEFIINETDVDMYEEDNMIVIDKGHSQLFVPKTTIEGIEDLNVMTKDYKYIGIIAIEGLKARIKSVIKTLGKCEADVYVYENNITIKAQTASTVYDTFVGEKDSGNLLVKFKMRLEIFNNIINLMPVGTELYTKGGYLCFKNRNRIILTSLL